MNGPDLTPRQERELQQEVDAQLEIYREQRMEQPPLIMESYPEDEKA